MVSVAITGAAGLLGRRLTDRLLARDEIQRVVAVDVADFGALSPPPILDVRTADVRDADLADHLTGCEAVVHLAFAGNPLSDLGRMRAINVDGTRNVFEAARQAGATKVIYTSSVVVYGAHPDNDFPLAETSLRRANSGFPYAEHTLEVEEWVWSWAARHPAVTVVVLRPALVVGRGVDDRSVRRLAEVPWWVAIRGHRPPWQFSHPDDVAGALEHAVFADLDGAYNVACEGWLPFEEVLSILGRRALSVPEGVAFALTEGLWQAGVTWASPGWLNYLMNPAVMNVGRLRSTGWEPAHSNRDSLRELADDHAGWVTLTGGRRVHTRSLKLAAGLAGGALTGLTAHRLLRRAG